jgi:2-hydroxy-3-keto-5-methylthiopentenyl-1-phosphate phosphatase
MCPWASPSQTGFPVNTLVTDFDGTLTRHDFFRLALERLVPPGVPDYWQQYRAGRLTHFEAMRGYYAAIRAGEAETLCVVEAMELEPELALWLKRLEQSGWKVVVASAGCAWYIHRLLQRQGVQVEVHANPGRFEEGRGLLLELPVGSPFFSPSHGIDKAAVVRSAQLAGRRVAFAGDGYPDAPAARLVVPELRFATSSLAVALEQEGLPFRRFDRWTEVARALVNG